jgi:hypothetical protein
MGRNLYFDRNVFHHIRARSGITDDDARTLKNAVAAGRIAILLSVTLIEETLPVLKASPETAEAEKQLVIDLTDPKKVIKPHAELLRDDVVAYAKGEARPSPFTTEFPGFLQFLTPRRADLPGLLGVVRDTQKQKLETQANFRRAKDSDSQYFKTRHKGPRPSFREYLDRHSLEMAKKLAGRFAVSHECRNRGFDGLLQIRSVKLYIGSGLSHAYAQIFEGRAPKPGDSRDLHHAVLASAADSFVTQDTEFARILNRLQVEDF